MARPKRFLMERTRPQVRVHACGRKQDSAERDRRVYLVGVLLAVLALAMAASAGCANKDGGRSSRSDRRANSPAPVSLEGVELASTQAGDIDRVGKIEPVALFYGAMPTGVTVSRGGRVFVNFPRWGDKVEHTVAEIRNGEAVAYPDAQVNRLDLQNPRDCFVSVQSVVVDPKDRLWVLDTGSINMGPVVPDGPKLVCIDLGSNRIVKKIPIPANVALKTTYLNDVRFDLTRGTEGMAFITDSSAEGPNAIIVVDLGSGRSWRKLNNDPSTRADPDFVPTVEGKPFMKRPPGGKPEPISVGADGIAISSDGERLIYCPLGSREISSVSVALLADENSDNARVAQTIRSLGPRNFASDGLESDAAGNLYLTDYENNAIRRRGTDGSYQIIAQDPRMIWPDTLSVAADGYLYFTVNQLNRQAPYNEGEDLRQKPYVLFRTKIDAKPVSLK